MSVRVRNDFMVDWRGVRRLLVWSCGSGRTEGRLWSQRHAQRVRRGPPRSRVPIMNYKATATKLLLLLLLFNFFIFSFSTDRPFAPSARAAVVRGRVHSHSETCESKHSFHLREIRYSCRAYRGSPIVVVGTSHNYMVPYCKEKHNKFST